MFREMSSNRCKEVVNRVTRFWSYEGISIENISGQGVEASVPNDFQRLSDFAADMDVSCGADVDLLWTGTGNRITIRPQKNDPNVTLSAYRPLVLFICVVFFAIGVSIYTDDLANAIVRLKLLYNVSSMG